MFQEELIKPYFTHSDFEKLKELRKDVTQSIRAFAENIQETYANAISNGIIDEIRKSMTDLESTNSQAIFKKFCEMTGVDFEIEMVEIKEKSERAYSKLYAIQFNAEDEDLFDCESIDQYDIDWSTIIWDIVREHQAEVLDIPIDDLDEDVYSADMNDKYEKAREYVEEEIRKLDAENTWILYSPNFGMYGDSVDLHTSAFRQVAKLCMDIQEKEASYNIAEYQIDDINFDVYEMLIEAIKSKSHNLDIPTGWFDAVNDDYDVNILKQIEELMAMPQQELERNEESICEGIIPSIYSQI